MSEELDDAERQKLLDNFKLIHSQEMKGVGPVAEAVKSGDKNKISSTLNPLEPSAGEAAKRGAMSGALMGFQPQVAGALQTGFGLLGDYPKSRDESKALNDIAFEKQPLSYGAGYTGAAIGTLPLGGALARGVGAIGKGLGAATTAKNVLPTVSSNALERGADLAVKGLNKIKDADKPGKLLPGPPTVGRAATSAIGYEENKPSTNAPPRNPEDRANDITPNPISSFEKLKQWLSSQADTDEDKRKLAMQLQASPEGRAMSNEDLG